MSLALNTVVSDEEHRIVGLLDHASRLCDELVVVVDECSIDGTFQLATDYGATVIVGPHSWFCEPLRPLAAAYTQADWILVLDGDEILSEEAVATLRDLDRVHHQAAKLPRRSTIDGVLVTESLDAHVRMFQRGMVRYGMNPHTRIEPVEWARVFAPQTPGWIIHSKTTAEHQADVDRTERAS